MLMIVVATTVAYGSSVATENYPLNEGGTFKGLVGVVLTEPNTLVVNFVSCCTERRADKTFYPIFLNCASQRVLLAGFILGTGA